MISNEHPSGLDRMTRELISHRSELTQKQFNEVVAAKRHARALKGSVGKLRARGSPLTAEREQQILDAVERAEALTVAWREAKAAAQAEADQRFRAGRIAGVVETATTRINNLKQILWETQDLVDQLKDQAEVNTRELLAVLASTEVNLEAACGRLAADLGLVAMPDVS